MTTGERSAAGVPGLRATKQRAAVSRLLSEVDDFRSAQDLHEQLRRRGEGIGLTTVYRTLQTLADAGEIDVLRTESGEAIYRRCSTEHHHHLVCRHCGRTVEVADPPVEQWAERIASEHGFSNVGHTVEIIGVCPECAAAE
ncbi:Fur family transcriptional regulator [Saccharopolyspora gloriosae]|uniref:Fur family ferric uptake transcriptional regulator n=1 Tax=Saccharopolyspora gloriosae TaxID=455344 RepID=A0A840NCU5_9PSEU|nr:Fur family transcriptional regulator [Saccharopolyspora sp. NFXS83]MBB5067945.1 Fur family ferric uptake transcriptional regulator [Saccharopolyspora gloriosae]MCX2731587.1 Fur family transcriptional regulator [Saccharopolyspora sp. NFXS83]